MGLLPFAIQVGLCVLSGTTLAYPSGPFTFSITVIPGLILVIIAEIFLVLLGKFNNKMMKKSTEKNALDD